MKKILELIVDELKPVFTACGYDESYARVTISNRPDLCQYQCNGAMAAAKAYKKKPIDIANEIVEGIQNNPVFSQVDAVMPGFINLSLNGEFIVSYMNGMAGEAKMGLEEIQLSRKIMIDYGGANVAKPLHVGHLRSAIIGESLKRIGRYLGYDMIGDVHLGDWGLQMGLIIEELKERQPDLPYFDPEFSGTYPENPPFTISELEEIYPAASGKSKIDEAFKERAQDNTLKLQSGYPPFRAIWQHIMNVSLVDLKKNYDNLQVEFDLWKGESDAQPYIPALLDDLVSQGLAYESQGALVVDIAMEGDTKELPPCLIRKSDGAALYATSDLATLVEREKDYQPDAYIYLTDKRQELHFTQVFRVAKMSGIVAQDKPMVFLGFGTMNGKDGKPFKTRDGGVMRLENLIKNIEEEAFNRIMENRDVTEEQGRSISPIIGMAALKYGDLSNQVSKDYVFDIERFTSFEGNTGPYILYTIVRIKSIIGKYRELPHGKEKTGRMMPPSSEAETALMLELTKFNEVIEASFAEYAPHKICQYIYDLSNTFNRFYHDVKIIGEEDLKLQESWISLITLVRDVLTACIGLLGFEAPDRM